MKNNFYIKNDKVYIEIHSKNRKVYAIVDIEDLEKVNKIKSMWTVHYSPRGALYVKGRFPESNSKDKREFLHRYLLNPPSDKVVDHIDGNPLNNSRSNLRVVSQKENCQNQVHPKKSKSGVTGVRWHSIGKKWQAIARPNGGFKSLGLYKTKEEAENVVKDYKKSS